MNMQMGPLITLEAVRAPSQVPSTTVDEACKTEAVKAGQVPPPPSPPCLDHCTIQEPIGHRLNAAVDKCKAKLLYIITGARIRPWRRTGDIGLA
jgi:hypothetical protein